MKDHFVRVMSGDGQVRALCTVTTELVAQACRLHDTLPTASVALGRALSAGVLMGGLLDGDQRVALKFEGSGPLAKILVEADALGAVRGFVGDPKVDLPFNAQGNFDVAGALGRAGFLTVTKDLRLKQPSRGIVQLTSSEIAEDLASYLTESEQIPSAVGLGVFVEAGGQIGCAGGFLVQAMPAPNDETLNRVIDNLAELPSLSVLLQQGLDPYQILERIFVGVPFEELERRDVRLACDCSRVRMERALITLGREQAAELIESEEPVEIRCEFCGRSYSFAPDELGRLFDEVH